MQQTRNSTHHFTLKIWERVGLKFSSTVIQNLIYFQTITYVLKEEASLHLSLIKSQFRYFFSKCWILQGGTLKLILLLNSNQL